MARKVINRKALRDEVEAAEAAEAAAVAAGGETKKKTAKRKSRAKTPVEVRKKLYWGVFSQSYKRVALFEYGEEEAARAKAEELSKGGKTPHFVNLVKEEIQPD